MRVSMNNFCEGVRHSLEARALFVSTQSKNIVRHRSCVVSSQKL